MIDLLGGHIQLLQAVYEMFLVVIVTVGLLVVPLDRAPDPVRVAGGARQQTSSPQGCEPIP